MFSYFYQDVIVGGCWPFNKESRGGAGTLKARGSKPALAQAAMAKVSRKDSNGQVVGVSNEVAVRPLVVDRQRLETGGVCVGVFL